MIVNLPSDLSLQCPLPECGRPVDAVQTLDLHIANALRLQPCGHMVTAEQLGLEVPGHG